MCGKISNSFKLLQLAKKSPFLHPVFVFFEFHSPAMQLKKAFNRLQNCQFSL